MARQIVPAKVGDDAQYVVYIAKRPFWTLNKFTAIVCLTAVIYFGWHVFAAISGGLL